MLEVALHYKESGWKGVVRDLLYLPLPGNENLGNDFLASGTVGGAAYYMLETCFFKDEKFKNVLEKQFSFAPMECHVVASVRC